MQGCFFTGVESTPKITAGQVRRDAPTLVTADDTLLAQVGPLAFPLWKPGMLFRVTDPRVSLIFGLPDSEGQRLNGHSLSYLGASESRGVTGIGVTDLQFLSPDGQTFTYRVNRPLASIDGLDIPFTIQTGMVSDADSLLRGRNVYVLSSVWRDDSDNPRRGRKFVPVTIDSVRPGTTGFPLKVAFTDTAGVGGRLFMYPGRKGSASRTFSDLFTSDNPRLKYPQITDENWQLITRGRLAEGMTGQEVRLSIGAPKEITRNPTQSFLREAWYYDSGHYLLFEDGLLKRF